VFLTFKPVKTSTNNANDGGNTGNGKAVGLEASWYKELIFRGVYISKFRQSEKTTQEREI
jgi:hypothetical protein